MNAFELMVEHLARRSAGLPPHVEAILQSCTLVPREKDGDLRIAVLAGGGRSFYLCDAEKRLRVHWPELSRQQVKRAVEYQDARAKLLRTAQCKPRRRNWALDF